MAKPTSKKVSRAARVGGGGRRRGGLGGRSLIWPSFVSLVVVLGTLGIVVSRQEHQSAASPLSAPNRDPSPPRVARDHWHAAYGVYVCGKFVGPITDQTDPVGIHTHGDGVIHVHPFKVKRGNPFTGKNANLGAFMRSVQARVSATEISIPGVKKRNGDKCKGKPAQVQVKTWKEGDADEAGTVVTGNPATLKLLDRMRVTIAFVPKGEPIPQPPSVPQLDRLNDVGPAGKPGAPPVPLPDGSTPPGATPPDGSNPPGATPPASGASDSSPAANPPPIPEPGAPPAAP